MDYTCSKQLQLLSKEAYNPLFLIRFLLGDVYWGKSNLFEVSKYLRLTLCLNRFYSQVFHMGVYPNSQNANTSRVQWVQLSLEKLVYLVIDHQCSWTCLLVKELRLAQSLELTCEAFLEIAHLQTWKLHCRYVPIDGIKPSFMFHRVIF